jgi:hypothetical protein
MERNIDRNIRMAIRRLWRGGARNGVFLVALFISFVVIEIIEPHIDADIFHDWEGWIILISFAAISALIFLLLTAMGIDLWGRRKGRQRARTARWSTHRNSAGEMTPRRLNPSWDGHRRVARRWRSP